MCQTRAVRTGVPKSTMLFFLLVLVCPCLSWKINPSPSPALSKMTTTSALEISTGREHCQTTSCTEEGLFPEGGPDMMTWWQNDRLTGWQDDRWQDDQLTRWPGDKMTRWEEASQRIDRMVYFHFTEGLVLGKVHSMISLHW